MVDVHRRARWIAWRVICLGVFLLFLVSFHGWVESYIGHRRERRGKGWISRRKRGQIRDRKDISFEETRSRCGSNRDALKFY
jgi:hypothetical protein